MKNEWWGGYSRHNELFREVYDTEGPLWMCSTLPATTH